MSNGQSVDGDNGRNALIVSASVSLAIPAASETLALLKNAFYQIGMLPLGIPLAAECEALQLKIENEKLKMEETQA